MNPRSITIVVPYEGSDTKTPIWAFEEESIDFRREHERAARCTTAFAAVELRDHLAKCLTDTRLTFAPRRPPRGPYIELSVDGPESSDETYTLAPEGEGVRISAAGRRGLLYGAWELLRLQGWRWYAPRAVGVVSPAPRAALTLPEAPRRYTPSFALGRGFDFTYVSQESAELWLWMARDRLNPDLLTYPSSEMSGSTRLGEG